MNCPYKFFLSKLVFSVKSQEYRMLAWLEFNDIIFYSI